MIIVRFLYGLNNAETSFRDNLANTLRTMGLKPTFSDRNMWMIKIFITLPQELNDFVGSGTETDTTALQPGPNTSNSDNTSGNTYYDYICTWVDDLLSFLHGTTAIMREIGSVETI